MSIFTKIKNAIISFFKSITSIFKKKSKDPEPTGSADPGIINEANLTKTEAKTENQNKTKTKTKEKLTLSANKKSLNVAEGETANISVNTNGKISVSSDDSNIASVKVTGNNIIVAGKTAGKTSIKITAKS